MRTTLDLRLVDSTAFEPGLVADLRDERRALLFDCGPQIQVVAPRTLLRTTHVFVSHTHMDHWAGFDHLLALGLGRMRHLVLWGGPGFCDQVQHKLAAYTWNVVQRYPVPMTIEAHALGADGTCSHARFDSRDGFARSAAAGAAAADGDVLHDEPLFRVRARIVDHQMPVLAFALEEKAQLRVALDRIRSAGMTPGPWLRMLKRAVLDGMPDDTPIDLAWRDAAGDHTAQRSVGALRPLVLDTVPGRRIGYVTDLRCTPANVEQLDALLHGADLLCIESVFSDADRDQAARKNHLTARQAGTIARRIGARRVLPFHFSARYRGAGDVLRREVESAFGAGPATATPA